MPAHLLSLTDGPSILIDKPILLFGRHEECDVQLNSKKVSRRHCCVAQVNDYLIVRDLDETALKRILQEPKNALVKQYQRLFEMENVTLTFTEDALAAVARRAIQRKTGARGLRSIMEGILLDTMFELPNLRGVEEVAINAEVVEGRARPLYVHSAEGQSASAS